LFAASARRWQQFNDLLLSRGPIRTTVLEAILLSNKGRRHNPNV
jgi:hypothetical protein